MQIYCVSDQCCRYKRKDGLTEFRAKTKKEVSPDTRNCPDCGKELLNFKRRLVTNHRTEIRDFNRLLNYVE